MGSRIYNRKENTVTYAKNQTVIVDLSRNYHVQKYTLKLSANITNAANAAYTTDNLFALINRIDITLNSNVHLKDITGEKLIFNSIIEKGIIGDSKLVKTVSTTNDNYQFAEIYLNVPDTIRPWDTILNTRVFDTYQLQVVFGDESNLGTNITINNAKLEIVSNQLVGYSRAATEQISYYKEVLLKELNILENNNNLQVTIPVQSYYRGIMLVSKNGNILDNGVINNIRLKSGTVVIIDEAADFIQNDNAFIANKAQYPANTGIYYLDFTPRGYLSDLINTVPSNGGFNTLELILDVNKLANKTEIFVYTEYIEGTGQYERVTA
jgi:hypothetical protein